MKILAITTAGKEYMYSIKSARGVVSRASCRGSGGGAIWT